MSAYNDVIEVLGKTTNIWSGNENTTQIETFLFFLIGSFLIGLLSLFIYSFLVKEEKEFWEFDLLKRNLFLITILSTIIGFIPLYMLTVFFMLSNLIVDKIIKRQIPGTNNLIFIFTIIYIVHLLIFLERKHKKDTILLCREFISVSSVLMYLATPIILSLMTIYLTITAEQKIFWALLTIFTLGLTYIPYIHVIHGFYKKKYITKNQFNKWNFLSKVSIKLFEKK